MIARPCALTISFVFGAAAVCFGQADTYIWIDGGVITVRAAVSGAIGTECFLFVPENQQAAHLRCLNLSGGTPETVQLFVNNATAGPSTIFTFPFAGGSSFSQDIASPPAFMTDALFDGLLGIRFNTSAGTQGQGLFAPMRQTVTLYGSMTPVQGNQDRRGRCAVSAWQMLNDPQFWLGVSCEHNVPNAINFFLHARTIANRGDTLFQIPLAGSSYLSGLRVITSDVFNAINTQDTNVNILSQNDWVASNNLPCHPGSTVLCLNNDRFQAQLGWRNSQGQTGTAGTAALTNDTGLFDFFNQGDADMLVKVINACSDSGTANANNRYWVFAGGLTNLEHTLTVTDTRSGQVKTYTNPLGTFAPPVMDTSAFATCP